MKPINQEITEQEDGDSLRACVASLLELPIGDVPHFSRSNGQWFVKFSNFIMGKGYCVLGLGYPDINTITDYTIGGLVIGTVYSKTNSRCRHYVLIDSTTFKVVHDPNPNKLWQNQIVTVDVLNWLMVCKP